MKFIISESRIERLVMNFLDEQFKGMKKHVDAIGEGTYTWWGVGNYGMVDMEIGPDGVLGVGINSEIYESLKGTFNLSSGSTDEFFIMWVEDNLGINPEEIYVF